MLEEALERLYEHIDLLAYLHAEQKYRMQMLTLLAAVSQPQAAEKMQQINAFVEAVKRPNGAANGQLPPVDAKAAGLGQKDS